MYNKRIKESTFEEVCAALTLIKAGIINENFSLQWIQDQNGCQNHPDLKINDFGIEVTSALQNYEGEKQNIEKQLREKGKVSFEYACEWFCKQKRKSKFFTIDKQEFSNNMYLFHAYSEVNSILFPYDLEIIKFPNSDKFSIGGGGGYNEEFVTNIITNSIAKKSDKFPNYKNPEQYKKRGLYIVRSDMITGRHLINLQPIQTVINKSCFNVLYLNVETKIIVICKDQPIYECSFSKENVNEVICEAKRILSHTDYDSCRKHFVDCYKREPLQFSGFTPT